MKTQPIFLVEDNSDDEALIIRSLGKSSLANDVVVARDGAEALDYLFATGSRAGEKAIAPAVVLLDVKLPKIDGLQVLQRLRKDARTKLLPLVMLTSSDEELDLLRSYQLGANSYVRKPVDSSEFTATITRLCQYWVLLNQRPPDNKG